jgi:hypothetical protein
MSHIISKNHKPVKSQDGPGSMEAVLSSMVKRASDGVVKVAPGIARRILDELNFPEQRRVDSSRIYSHGDNIRRGDWMEGHPITLVLLPDGRIWLVDGQHRLHAIASQDQAIAVTVRIVPMESEKEARFFYAGFDQKNSVRTDRQILDAVDITGETGLRSATTTHLFRAAPLLLNGLEPIAAAVARATDSDVFLQANKLAIVREWSAEAKAFEKVLDRATIKGLRLKLCGSGVMAVALYTLRHQPKKAQDFWHGLAGNDGLRKGDPRATLLADLMFNRALNVGSHRQKVQQPAAAWNAFCEGRDLKIIKCIDGAALTLWGTPLAKGRAE